ncbi:hypothetical protein [Pilimelia columellifera]|uniref:TolB-like translocation protein n=1 Tax=Pilimelia columellifera subsp. columellifera TaxID=706583 RepID=A0ABN3NT93_9ACTN
MTLGTTTTATIRTRTRILGAAALLALSAGCTAEATADSGKPATSPPAVRYPHVAEHKFPESYLDNAAMAVHLSTGAYDKPERGLLFMFKKGAVETFRTDGLDGAQLTRDGRRSMWIPQLRSDTVIGLGGRNYPRTATNLASTSHRVGNGYATFFNHRRSDVPSGYEFKIAWTRNGKHQVATIPYFVQTAGVCGGRLYAIGTNRYGPEDPRLQPALLLRIDLTDRARTTLVALEKGTIENNKAGYLGEMLCHAGTPQAIWFSNGTGNNRPPRFWLTRLNPLTRTLVTTMLHNMSPEDDGQHEVPWYAMRSAHQHRGQLYHIDGAGTLRATSPITGKVVSTIPLAGAPRDADASAATGWLGDKLAILYQPDEGDAVLSIYRITDGTQIRAVKVPEVTAAIATDDALWPRDLLLF